MATPEQNAMLAIQLFGAPAQQFNQQNDRQTAAFLELTNRNREEQLKRELADQAYRRSIELANMQGDREDTRANAAASRQLTQLQAVQDREDTRAADVERRQAETIKANDRKQITAEMNRLYPQYAQAAARAGHDIIPRTEFAETNEGLGQLAAELRTAEVGYEQAQKKAAAEAMMGDVDEVKTAMEQTKNRLAELSRPTPEDQKFAHSRAITALKQAIETGSIESTKSIGKDAITKGIAALDKGDTEVAAGFFGKAADEVLSAYDGAVDQTLMALPNQKARMQEKAQVNQQFLALQSQLGRVTTDIRKAAAVNPFLASGLSERRNGLDQLMEPVPEAPRQRTLDQIFQKPPAAGQPAPATQSASVINPAKPTDNPGTVFDLNTFSIQPRQKYTETAAPDSGTRLNEQIGDTLRAGGYGLLNFMSPGNWRGDFNAVQFDPPPSVLIPQLQSRLAQMSDKTSPAAQQLRAQLSALLKQVDSTTQPVVPPAIQGNSVGWPNFMAPQPQAPIF